MLKVFEQLNLTVNFYSLTEDLVGQFKVERVIVNGKCAHFENDYDTCEIAPT